MLFNLYMILVVGAGIVSCKACGLLVEDVSTLHSNFHHQIKVVTRSWTMDVEEATHHSPHIRCHFLHDTCPAALSPVPSLSYVPL